MMKKYIYNILVLVLAGLLFTPSLLAQVKIGDTTPPASFSILELDTELKKGGFRLPQLDNSKCNALKIYLSSLQDENREAANGLVVYNTEVKEIWYWDGTDWASADALSVLKGENGVNVIDELSGGLSLGGELTENTTIKLQGNTLNFPVVSDKDQFLISNTDKQENTLNIKDGKVGIGGVSNPSKALDIYNTDPTLPLFKYENAGEALGNALVSDMNGNAVWGAVKPLSSVVWGAVDEEDAQFGAGHTGKNNSTDYLVTESNGALALTPGKWLIVGKFTARVANTTANKQFLAYLTLMKTKKKTLPTSVSGTSTDYTICTRTSALPSQVGYVQVGTSTSWDLIAMPQVFYYANVESGTDYYFLMANSSVPFYTTPFSGSYFFALRIDANTAGVDINVTATSTQLASQVRTLKTGETLINETAIPVTFKVNNGVLDLTKGGIVGSFHGINLVVADDDVSIAAGESKVVNIMLSGTLEGKIAEDSFRVPFSIGDVTFVNSTDGPQINIPTEGSLNCDNLSLDKNVLYMGQGQSVNDILNDLMLGIDLTSGSVHLSEYQLLDSKNGISMQYASSMARTYYAPNYYNNVPVSISGTVNSTATGQFTLVPSVPLLTDCSGGLVINIVKGSLNCGGTTLESRSKTPIEYNTTIAVTLDNVSTSYPLASRQVLGLENGIKVTYTGSTINLTPGSTQNINVTVSSSAVKANGDYTVNLNNLVRNGIQACTMNITVKDFGAFGSVENVSVPASEENAVNQVIQVPLTVNSNSITINNGEVLGSVRVSGKTYTVKAETESPIVVTASQTVNIPARLSGPAEAQSGVSYTIPLNNVPGVVGTNVVLNIN